MSDYVGADGGSEGRSTTAQAAKSEAAGVKDTTVDAAKDVAGTAGNAAKAVAGEVKAQASDLYAQVKRELTDQAGKQQNRLASGLADASDQLKSMADGSDGGVAADLAQRASARVGAAASWLQERDPAGVLDDVKAYARRRPAVFIAGAAIAGIVIGRLTRALASSAADSAKATSRPTDGDRDDDAGESSAAVRTGGLSDSDPSVSDGFTTGPLGAGYASDSGSPDPQSDLLVDEVIVADDDTPLYDDSLASRATAEEPVDDRRDTF